MGPPHIRLLHFNGFNTLAGLANGSNLLVNLAAKQYPPCCRAHHTSSPRDFTENKEKTVRRHDFAHLADADLREFERMLGAGNVKTSELDPYNRDFMRWYVGESKCVLLPDTAEQVSTILRHCYERRLAVVPQSGNTGLVGGSVPVFDEIILSTRKLRSYFELEPNAGILECDAGFVLEELDERLAAEGWMMPVDLGAKGSCLIGGNVATNAGGIRYVRYGSLQANTLGLRVVLPDSNGTSLQFGAPLISKDNADLHLKNLFIGSEGQLGVITRVAIRLAPKPVSQQSAWLACESYEKCVAVLREARLMLAEILAGFEMMDAGTLQCVQENTGLAVPLQSTSATIPPFNLLIESHGSNEKHDAEKMEAFLSHCLDSGLIVDGTLAATIAESQHFWKLREQSSLALLLDGYVYKHDLSLPLKHFYELNDIVAERLKGVEEVKRVVTFGHLGDGNAHLNITLRTKEPSQRVFSLLYPFIYEWTSQRNGSISAEHGVGRLKRTYHLACVPPKRLEINRQVKAVFDPRRILSPYKMID